VRTLLLGVVVATGCTRVESRPCPPCREGAPPDVPLTAAREPEGVVLRESGLGPLDAHQVTRLEEVRKLFPGIQVSLRDRPAERMALQGGRQAYTESYKEIEVETDEAWVLDVSINADDTLERIEIHGPMVPSHHGLRVGDRWGKLRAAGAPVCSYSKGDPEYVECMLGSSHLEYTFFLDEDTPGPGDTRGPLVEAWLVAHDPPIDQITWVH
jgi:hypothetical protein